MTVETPFEVIVSGVLCLDLLPLMTHIPLSVLASPGKLTEVGSLSVSTGGAVSNTGLALHRLGINVGLMARVGDDLIGQASLDFLASYDSALTRLISVEKGGISSYTLVLSPENVDRLFLHCTGVNSTFTSHSIQYENLAQAEIFHLGYPPTLPNLYANAGAELITLMRRAKATGVVTSIDMTLPDAQSASGRADWASILAQTLLYTDIFIPSLEEVVYMLRRKDYDRWRGQPHQHITRQYVVSLTNQLIEMGATVAGVKLGALGIFVQTGNRQRVESLTRLNIDPEQWSNAVVYQPAYNVNVMGTTGAGDAAYAGFLAAAIRGASPADAARWACAVGACNVEAVDSVSGVRTWAETETRINSGWRQSTMRLSDV